MKILNLNMIKILVRLQCSNELHVSPSYDKSLISFAQFTRVCSLSYIGFTPVNMKLSSLDLIPSTPERF